MSKTEPTVANSPLNTRYGTFQLYVFSWSENEQDNILTLVAEGSEAVPLVRVQSACYTGEIFESLDCDCHWQLETSLAQIAASGEFSSTCFVMVVALAFLQRFEE